MEQLGLISSNSTLISTTLPSQNYSGRKKALHQQREVDVVVVVVEFIWMDLSEKVSV